MSLAARVMLFVALAIVLCLLGLRVIIERSIDHHFVEQDAKDLQVVADAVQRILRLYQDEPQQLPAALAQAVPLRHGVFFQVGDPSGRVLYAAPGPDLDPLARAVTPMERVSPAQLYSWQAAERVHRGAVVSAEVGDQGLLIATAIDMAFHDDFMARFRQTLWAIMGGAGLLTLLAAWMGLRQGLSPLRELSGNIRHIRSDRLQTRLDAASVPAELKELVHSFNHMLGQLDEGFSQLSHFSADIAHELRTPLTNLITQTQVALGSPRSAAEYRDVLYSNLEELECLAKMVSDMLWLAQTDRGLIRPVFESLDLAEEIRALFDYFGAWADEKNIRLELDGPATTVQGDRSMLRRALANLLSNALRHTPAQGTVRVRLSIDSEQHASLAVQNTGSDIPAEHRSRIFDRFFRIDFSRCAHGEGAGLGLAIVKSIVEVHGGDVTASSEAGVTTFTITFPDSSAIRRGGIQGSVSSTSTRSTP